MIVGVCPKTFWCSVMLLMRIISASLSDSPYMKSLEVITHPMTLFRMVESPEGDDIV